MSLSLLVACANGAPPNGAQPAASPAAASDVSEAQALLAELGYGPGDIDGIQGPQTVEAIRTFQAETGLKVDGRVSESLVVRLRAERRALVLEAQIRLAALGFDPGPADGKAGTQTRKAALAFQRDQNLDPDGQVTPDLIAQLAAANGAGEAEIAASRPEAGTEQEASVATADKAAQIAALDGGSTLRPGDRVLLSYYGSQSTPAETKIDPDGRLALPEVGQVQAAGLDLEELRDHVTVKLIESYLGKLDVGVRLASMESAPEAAGSRAHVLSPGDRLFVRTGAGDENPTELEVDQDGWVMLPEAGKLRAAGLGLTELRDEITVALLETYKGKLKVTVRLADARRPVPAAE